MTDGTGENSLQQQKKNFFQKMISHVIPPLFFLQMANRQKKCVILLATMLPSGAYQLNKFLNMKSIGWVKPPLWLNLPCFPYYHLLSFSLLL